MKTDENLLLLKKECIVNVGVVMNYQKVTQNLDTNASKNSIVIVDDVVLIFRKEPIKAV